MFDKAKAAVAALGKYKWVALGVAVVVLGVMLYAGAVDVSLVTE